MTKRVRLRTNCSRKQDSVILSCPFTSQILICQTFGLLRITGELADVYMGDALGILLSWLATKFSGCYSDWIGKGWWGRNGESRIPEFPGPQTPWLSLVIVYNFFVFLAPFPHAVILNLKSMWEGENAEHHCIVSSTVPAMLYIDMSCYYIYKYIYNFVRFLHLRSSQILYFFLFCLSCFLHWSVWVLKTDVHSESGF